jgi:hypothetical protein
MAIFDFTALTAYLRILGPNSVFLLLHGASGPLKLHKSRHTTLRFYGRPFLKGAS